ncbi:MAG: acyl carrier protein [Planctomycetota bacterium]|jgi:acyl carrier protein
MKSIEQELTAIIGNTMAVPTERINLDTKLVDDLGRDLGNVAEMTIDIQQIFKIHITEDAVAEAKTVEELVKLISDKI